MALWIKAKRDTTGFKVEPVAPLHDGIFTVAELRRFVGGTYLDHLRLNDGHIMWLNHDRNKFNLPLNSLANTIAHEETGIPHNEIITGDALLANAIESGEEKSQWKAG